VTRVPLNCLVVEDNIANQKLLGKILKSFGHRIDFADNGARAVELIANGKYDAVLMDVQMPVMDGITASKIARESGFEGAIIAMTASTMKGDEQNCISAGMDAYLSKPVDIELLEGVVRGVIEKKASGAVKKNGLHASAEISQDGPVETLSLDVEKLRRNMAGKMELMSDAVEMFIEYYPKYCAEIKRAIDARDPAAIKMSSHKLKGTALNASATAIAAMLLELETIGKSGGSDGTAEIFEKLGPEFDRYKAAAAKAGLLVSGV